jgi:hypothetical protein
MEGLMTMTYRWVASRYASLSIFLSVLTEIPLAEMLTPLSFNDALVDLEKWPGPGEKRKDRSAT